MPHNSIGSHRLRDGKLYNCNYYLLPFSIHLRMCCEVCVNKVLKNLEIHLKENALPDFL